MSETVEEADPPIPTLEPAIAGGEWRRVSSAQGGSPSCWRTSIAAAANRSGSGTPSHREIGAAYGPFGSGDRVGNDPGVARDRERPPVRQQNTVLTGYHAFPARHGCGAVRAGLR